MKNPYLTRYWFEFDLSQYPALSIPFAIQWGCGISHFSFPLALNLLKEKVFRGREMPPFTVKEGIDVSTLDAGHVLPNMKPPSEKGIWFPMGFED